MMLDQTVDNFNTEGSLHICFSHVSLLASALQSTHYTAITLNFTHDKSHMTCCVDFCTFWTPFTHPLDMFWAINAHSLTFLVIFVVVFFSLKSLLLTKPPGRFSVQKTFF